MSSREVGRRAAHPRAPLKRNMRILAALTLLLTAGAQSPSNFVAGDDPDKAANAFSSAARLPAIDARHDELRIWRRDYMTGRVLGYAMSDARSIRCTAASRYTNGTVIIERANCRRLRTRLRDMQGVGEVASLDGKQWDCPMFDGEAVYVQGARVGVRFSLRVGNPGACDDIHSQAVAHLLRQLR